MGVKITKIKRYFPEEHANKIKELYGEETENV